MKLYTKKGDDGKTSILGPKRILKDDTRVNAYGTVDELNAILGITMHHLNDHIKKELLRIQAMLFEVGTELASEVPKDLIKLSDVEYLENLIDQSTKTTPKLQAFILPGGTKAASWLHLARTVARRAERNIVSLSKDAELSQHIIPWINRLSDLFFAWSREVNFESKVKDIEWKSRG
ncbi:MAG: cob(I)yrinic acid a,c-diamide adenosyltransferase [Candidatus Kariarchaeaceae archaeon]|jgi:cob(I)alamin adenosyltransferase